MTRGTRYPAELRERAVRLVQEHAGEYPSQWSALTSIATKCSMTPRRGVSEHWLKASLAEVSEGSASTQKPGRESLSVQIW